jgi:hypothetical protein
MVVVIPAEATVNDAIALQVLLDTALVLTVKLSRQATPCNSCTALFLSSLNGEFDIRWQNDW